MAVRASVPRTLNHYQVAVFIVIQLGSVTEISHRRLRAGRLRVEDPMHVVKSKRPQLHVIWDRSALRTEARTDGVFPLSNNIEGASKGKILEIYKYRPYIEKRFELTKTECGIASLFLKKPRRVVAPVNLYFLALMLASRLEREARNSMRRQAHLQASDAARGSGLSLAQPTPSILESFEVAGWHKYIDHN